MRKNLQDFRVRGASLAWLSLCILLCGLPARTMAQSQQPATNAIPKVEPAGAQTQVSDPQASGSLSGTIVYEGGAPIVGARVALTRPGQITSQSTVTGEDGQFSFDGVAPGAFQLTITAEGFETQTIAGELHASEAYLAPPITLRLATVKTEIQVRPPEVVAQEEVRQQEKQRVLGVIPNFYVTYVPNPVPLTPKQKFGLAWRTVIDPVTIVGAGTLAGMEQASDRYSAYGQGAQGYGKRFGAAYADIVDGTFIGGALLPSLLKQDPRYFYRGTGSTKSRLLYAISNSIISKSDSGHWEPNYSGLLGGAITGGIANAYYPARNRGVGLVFSTLLTRMAESSIAGIFNEFVGRKLTSNVPPSSTNQP